MNHVILKNWGNIRPQYCPWYKIRKKISQKTLDMNQAKLIM